MKCSCRIQWNGGMRGNELGDLPGWERAGGIAGAPISEGLTMIRTSFRVALSALFFAGALGLASTGAAQAQSIMKQCGDDWKAAKANNTTNGLTWPQFLKQCRTEKEGARLQRPLLPPLPPRLLSRRLRRRAISRSRSPSKPLARPAPANSARRPKPRRAAPATRWSGSTPRASPTPIITQTRAGTERPSRAPTCARPMLGRRAITPSKSRTEQPKQQP